MNKDWCFVMKLISAWQQIIRDNSLGCEMPMCKIHQWKYLNWHEQEVSEV